jgi:hypothetical protein
MKYLKMIFGKGDELSSKRIESYIVIIFMFIYILFFNPLTEIVLILATLAASLQGLTLFKKDEIVATKEDEVNEVG